MSSHYLSYMQLAGNRDESLILKKIQSVLSDHPTQSLEKCSQFGTECLASLWCLELARLLDTFSIKAVLLNYALIVFLTRKPKPFLCIIAPIGNVCTNSYK